MYKQILKGLTMLALILTVAFVNAAVSAQGQRRHVSAEVPFEFIVGDTKLPAGKYTIRAATVTGESILISNREQRLSVFRLSTGVMRQGNTKVCLVFHRYGNEVFLSQIWSGDPLGRAIQKSRQQKALERELANIASKTDFASGAPEVVEVVAILN